MTSRIQCVPSRSPDRSRLGLQPRCTSSQILHTLRTCTHVLPKNTAPRREPRSASSKSDILESGTTVASLFFENVFGAQAQKALTVFVALRCVLRVLLRIYQILFMDRVTVHWGERH